MLINVSRDYRPGPLESFATKDLSQTTIVIRPYFILSFYFHNDDEIVCTSVGMRGGGALYGRGLHSHCHGIRN